jgi:hypothetical protein
MILLVSCAENRQDEEHGDPAVPQVEAPTETNYKPVQSRGFELPVGGADKIENMTDEELLAIALGLEHDFILPEHHMFDDFGVPLKEGRGWPYGEQEEWAVMFYSADSREEAEQSITDRIIRHDDEEMSIEYSLEYIGENDYYYAFRLEYTMEVTDEYSELLGWNGITRAVSLQRMIVYKADVIRRGGDVGTWYSYFPPESLDFETILHILDLETFSPAAYGEVVYRDFTENEDKFIYTYYDVRIVWHPGVGPEYVYMEEITIYVDKSTGHFGHYTDNYSYREVKGVGVPWELIQNF